MYYALKQFDSLECVFCLGVIMNIIYLHTQSCFVYYRRYMTKTTTPIKVKCGL